MRKANNEVKNTLFMDLQFKVKFVKEELTNIIYAIR